MEGDWEEENPNFRSKNGQIVEIERESPRIARVAASERVYLFIITIFFFLFFFWERGGGRRDSTGEAEKYKRGTPDFTKPNFMMLLCYACALHSMHVGASDRSDKSSYKHGYNHKNYLRLRGISNTIQIQDVFVKIF